MEPTKLRASELRIGNWIKGESNLKKQIEILQLFSDSYQGDFGNGERGCMMYSNSEGILITEEWLKRAGFKKEKATGYGGQDMWAGMSAYSIDGVWLFRGTPSDLHLVGYFNTVIQYVHQLQNLYFALTGSELTIKEL